MLLHLLRLKNLRRAINLMKRNLDSSESRSRKVRFNIMSTLINGGSMPSDVEILETPIKSENDKKEYRVIRLKNGLTALLISDLTSGPLEQHEKLAESSEEEETMSVGTEDSEDGELETTDSADNDRHGENETLSAASLSIGVGSFEDPDDIPGLAHFLEHMVFMGSRKYPEENDFDAFIKKQGGNDNASTDWDYTTFYFISQPRHLRIALDKFSQFFISPLMKKDTMQREREAIESEFKLALPSDYHRKKQLLGSLAKASSAACKFPWGNVATLGGNSGDQQEEKDAIFRERLHQFWIEHYVASSMYLALQSRHDLDTLQKWVIECFSYVSPGNKIPISAQKSEAPFDTVEFHRLYHVSPVKDICQLDLTWALPSLLDKYESKPDKYISWLLGHEGKGSLLSYLREKVWALHLYSGSDESGADHNSKYMQFGLTLVLTEQGLENLREVIECVFSYINMLKDEGPQERIFNEIKTIMEVKFRFAAQPNSGDNVESMSENMLFYPPKHYICGPELFFKYVPQEIMMCLNYLAPDKVNIILLNKDSKVTYNQHEKWFNTPYLVEDIPDEWLISWKNAKPRPEFTLPPPNEYLATDFSLLPPEIDIEKPPVQLKCDEYGELWFKQDSKFKLPKAYLYFQLISPLPGASPADSVMLDLFITILRQQLTVEVYAAEAAELSYSLYPSMEGAGFGLGLQLHGFSQKLHLLLATILKQMVTFEQDLSLEMFAAVKDKQKKKYYNMFLKPAKLLKDVYQNLLKTLYWTHFDRYAAIDDITYEKLANFAREFRKRLYVRSLIQGNINEQQACTIMEMLRLTLNYKPLLPNTWPQLRLAQVEVGSRVCRVQSFNTESCNSVVSHTFYCGLASIRDCCIAELLMLLLEEAAFDTLRTKEQLGYDVSSHHILTRGVLNFTIAVHSQEDKHAISHVDQRVWEFLRGFGKELLDLKESELDELRKAAMLHKIRADLQLQEEVERNWEEVTTTEKLFNRIHLEHAILGKITKDDLTSFFRRNVLELDSTTRHLCIQVQGSCQMEGTLQELMSDEHKEERFPGNHWGPNTTLKILKPEENSQSKPILNIQDYRNSLFYYPVHKIIT